MRSKEDCLINQAGAYLLKTDQLFHPLLSTTGRNIGSIVVDRAMDEYAKEVAIAYDKWKANEGWFIEKLDGKMYYNKIHESFISADELFNQFIENQSQSIKQ